MDTILVLVTIVLAGITFWYAKHTKRIADIMARDYESKVSPLIELVRGNGSINLDSYNQQINLFNRGSVVVFIRDIKLRAYLKDRPDVYVVDPLNSNIKEIFPDSEPKSLAIQIRRSEINNETIRDTSNKFQDNIRFKVEMEIAGPDGIYQARHYDI